MNRWSHQSTAALSLLSTISALVQKSAAGWAALPGDPGPLLAPVVKKDCSPVCKRAGQPKTSVNQAQRILSVLKDRMTARSNFQRVWIRSKNRLRGSGSEHLEMLFIHSLIHCHVAASTYEPRGHWTLDKYEPRGHWTLDKFSRRTLAGLGDGHEGHLLCGD